MISLPELAAIAPGGWLVGGAVRDRVLGRSCTDFDVVVAGDAQEPARALARATGGHCFALSDRFGAWRVIDRDRRWQVDVMTLIGETIEADLARRDLTINAIAEPLGGGAPIDPFGGLEDLAAGRIRMVSDSAFQEDPLRVLRVARLACELGFIAELATVGAARAAAPALDGVAGERIFAELKRIVCADRALDGLRLMDVTGATTVVLPELAALHGVEQSAYHHRDVHDHTLLVLRETIMLARDPGAQFPDHAEALQELLAEPLADGLTRGQALRFGALLHDAAKPQTRAVNAEGRVTFLGHDRAGADLARAVLGRLRASERLADHVAALTRRHLVLGFLVNQVPLDRRAVYRYMRACEPVEVDVTLLSVADRLATRGRGSDQAIAKHLQLAHQLVGEALSWRAAPPQPPVRGDRLARAIGIRPGPRLGELLRELEQETFAGEIGSEAEAIARARELLGSIGSPP
jgi:putative nucleotidyltransferase with HDIG domain